MGRGGKTPALAEDDGSDDLRLDKWIWFARFQRSREACADLVRGGRVRINGQRVVKPGAFIAPGDILTLALPGRTLVVEVIALAQRRGDADSAQALYRIINAP